MKYLRIEICQMNRTILCTKVKFLAFIKNDKTMNRTRFLNFRITVIILVTKIYLTVFTELIVEEFKFKFIDHLEEFKMKH